MNKCIQTQQSHSRSLVPSVEKHLPLLLCFSALLGTDILIIAWEIFQKANVYEHL